ncbi:MAG: hypothetical protein J5608_01595 [Alphaproteobacteria bacterium]|nr:hypothetical protein [Alphaproteobacteria bacterium]
MTKDDINFERVYNNLKEREGGYTTGKNQKQDEPTNMGIKQSTLDRYANAHPDKKFPHNVKDLKAHQAKEIYKSAYWDNTNIPRIENDRIRNAVFDMNVMSGTITTVKTVQRVLNQTMNTDLPITGFLGPRTIGALNAIPYTDVDDFMNALKHHRLLSLQKMKNWETAKNGWTARTNAY